MSPIISQKVLLVVLDVWRINVRNSVIDYFHVAASIEYTVLSAPFTEHKDN